MPPGYSGMKQRPGDQMLPIKTEHSQDIFPLVIADLRKRQEVGVERYGRPLQSHNGRDSLQDAYEEALDLCVYLKQCIVERS